MFVVCFDIDVISVKFEIDVSSSYVKNVRNQNISKNA